MVESKVGAGTGSVGFGKLSTGGLEVAGIGSGEVKRLGRFVPRIMTMSLLVASILILGGARLTSLAFKASSKKAFVAGLSFIS